MKYSLCVALVLGSALVAPHTAGAQSGTPTFSKDVAPIFYQSCTSCHRPGEVAPMSLLSFAAARPYARSIATRVTQGTMPPWHADPAHGEFENARTLTSLEKDTIVRWATGGAPEGNPADLPAQPVYPGGWTIGEPDAVFELTEDYPVPASGTIDYKHFEVPTTFAEDRWIQAYQVRPGAPQAVHHVIVYARPPRRAPQAGATPPAAPVTRPQPPFAFAPGMNMPSEVRTSMAKQAVPNDRPVPPGGLGGFAGGFTPGEGIRVYGTDTAMRLAAGTTLIFQMHYTATGKPVTDRTKIGFVFAKTPPKHEVMTVALVNQNFTLPAGAPNTKVDAQMTFNQPATIWSILPHTHVRGREWKVDVTYPDGRNEVVLAVPKYDFNWQADYVFKQPLRLPKGTVLRTTAWYDNSSANKSNPDPSVEVHWGEQTWEEMQFTAMTITLDPPPAPTAAQP